MSRNLDVLTSFTSSVARLGAGYIVRRSRLGPRPSETLSLYEFEACPFCRKVREALTELDLSAMIFPCPKGGDRFRPEVIERGGRASFPYLVDPNQGVELYESDDIVKHLWKHYGKGGVPLPYRITPLNTLGSAVASLPRPTQGSRARPSRAPERPLTLYSFEASPYCRIVREALCELELPYRIINVGKMSPSRVNFRAQSGRMMVPYLVDPNRDVAMFESTDIVRYLNANYAR